MELNFLRSLRPGAGQPLGGRYKIIEQLGAGGFGQTFRAQDLHLPGQPLCVVKQLKPQVNSAQGLQVARRLFDTEARVLYELGSHPQIPRLLAHFEHNKEFYLAQELIEGHSLSAEFATSTPWREAEVVAFLGDVLGTLAFVHQHRVIHRDLKPSNLIRRRKDNRIVLIDFGAVKQVSTQLVTTEASISHTISIGTQGYMPNEQLAGRPQFSSDVYAVGIMGIQALTGRHPKVLAPNPHTGEIDWHAYAPYTHPNLIAVLDFMVQYDFRTRYTTAGEALSSLWMLPHELTQFIPPLVSANSDLGVAGSRHEYPEVADAGQPSQSSNVGDLRAKSDPLQNWGERSANPIRNPQRPQDVNSSERSPSPRSRPHRAIAQPQVPSSPVPHKTVPVIGQHSHTSRVQGRPTRTSVATEVAPSPQLPPHRKPVIPVITAIAVAFGVGVLTWRACTPADPVGTTADRSDEISASEEASPSESSAIPTSPPELEETPLPASEPETVSPTPQAETIPSEETSVPPPSDEIFSENQSEDETAITETPEENSSQGGLTPEAAQTTVANFYSYVSNQSWDAARALSAGALEQQFDPNFFQQFQQVTVENLQVTSQTTNTMELSGTNTYIYEDGSTQEEERTYTVQMVDGQPRITGSNFVRVIRSR